MKQEQIVAAAAGQAQVSWVELEPGIEVMAWPARVDGALIAVSARAARAGANALRGFGFAIV